MARYKISRYLNKFLSRRQNPTYGIGEMYKRRWGILAISLFLMGRPIFAQEAAPSQLRAPNIIIILIDDMGWQDTGFSGNTLIETPELDEWSEQGITFTTAYAAAPNCAPSRASLLTGLAPPRHGIYTVVDDRHSPGKPYHKIISAESKAELAGEETTMAEVLSDEGYNTCLVGMWNLGKGNRGPRVPTSQGFDIAIEPKDLNFDKDQYWNESGEYLTDKMTDSCIEFISEKREEPFFLYAAYHAIHSPFEAPPELVSKYEEVKSRNQPRDFAEYAATVEAIDINMGRLREAIEKQGLNENTYVFFTSDNGGVKQFTPPLRNGKGTLYEGGVRVPFFVVGPNIESQKTDDTPVTALDLFPTISTLAGAKKWPTDGDNLLPLLTGEEEMDERPLFWHFPCYIGGGGPSSSVRLGSYKLIELFESNTIELYNLDKDISESRNLAQAEPEKAAQMYTLLREWQDETGAPRPSEPNPAYDPSADPEKDRSQRNKGSE